MEGGADGETDRAGEAGHASENAGATERRHTLILIGINSRHYSSRAAVPELRQRQKLRWHGFFLEYTVDFRN